MDIDQILNDARTKMDKSAEYFQNELKGIRSGRATTALIEHVKVDYYGSPTELKNLGAISVPEPTQLVVKVFDTSANSAIVKALEAANLGLNPQPEGDSIRISVPPPSGERRQQLVAQIKKLAEDARVAVRNERREANKHIDQAAKAKDSHLSEDEVKSAKERVDELTKAHTDVINKAAEDKEAEVLQV